MKYTILKRYERSSNEGKGGKTKPLKVEHYFEIIVGDKKDSLGKKFDTLVDAQGYLTSILEPLPPDEVVYEVEI